MAKNTQEARVDVYLNGEAAKNEIKTMKEQLDEFTKELLRLQKTPVGALKPGEVKKMGELRKETQKMEKQIKSAEDKTEAFARTLKNINSSSLKDLQAAARRLSFEVKELAPGTQAFIEKSKQLKDVNTRIVQLRTTFKGLVAEEKAASISLKGLSEGFNRYFGMLTAGIAAITGVSMALKKCAQDAAAMDDAYATVMKTTGLTHEEVEQLNDAFKRMDTRTARDELNKMAYEAGKLGYTGVENIRQFVEAADVINVALGDVLGEGATLEIAKLAQVFAQSTAALDNLDLKGRMLAVGSAVNQLGKESTASESYMVDFLGRLGGVATQAGISADQILGYASALDQMKQKVEMSATAFQKLIQQMIKKPEEFVEAARMPLDEFTKMMETDMNGAIKRVLEGFNQMGGFTQLVPVFKDMGLDGARAASVIAALAANLDKVSAAQATANEHIRLGTSMTREYNIMNTSMQAKLEKARKEFKDICIELGQKLNPVMLKSTKATTYLIKALATYGKEIRNALITIAALTVAVKASTIAHAAYHAVVKGITAIQSTFTVAIKAASYAINIMRGRTIAATKAYLAMKAAMSTSVFGAIATAASALVMVITHLINKEKEAANAMSYVQSVEKKVVETYAEEEAKIRTLHSIVRDNNIALDQRKKALKELQEIVPEYHASLTKEGQLIEGNTVFLDKYIEKLREATRWQVYQDEWQDLERQLIEVQDNITKFQQKAQDELIRNGGNKTEKVETIVDTWGGGTKVEEYYTKYGEYMRSVKYYREEETKLLAQQKEIHGKMGQMSKQETRELTAQEKEIDAIQKKYELLFAEAKNAYVGAPAEGMKAMGKLQEQMNAEIAAIRKKYAQPTATDDGGGGGSGTPVKGDANKKAFDEEIKLLEISMRREENALKQSLMNREISQAEYNARMNVLTMKGLQKRIELAKKYGQDETRYVSQLLDEEIRLIGDGMEDIQEEMSYMPTTPKPGDIVDPQANEEFWEKVMSKRDEIVSSLKDQSLKDDYDNEMRWIEKLHEQELLTEEQFQRAKLETKIKYLQEYAQQYNTIQEQASNFVNALKEYETQKAEAEYQAQLTAAGDNAEEREAVEAAYEQKKLDIQKKYADTEMVINIAKTVAAGALAAIQAFAQLGPIGGAVAAALIAVTTALEVATIVQQRNAIKNASVNSSGSSSTPKTGNRTMTGYSEGGETPWAPSDDTPVGIVHANEYVIPAWMKRREPVLIENLERYRKSGSRGKKGSASQGFVDGGDTGMPVANGRRAKRHGGDFHAYVKATVMDLFETGAIRVVLVRKDLSELDDQDERFKNQTSRWNS